MTDIRQVTGLLPYLDLLEPSAVFGLWDLCNERGWYAFRRDHLDSALTSEWRDRALLGEAKVLADLDRMAAQAGPLWLDHWIERFLKTGEAKQSLMDLVGKWLAARKNLEALRVAMALIAEIGVRSDLPVLTGTTAIEPAKTASAVIADAAYWIRRRTLV